MPPTPASPKSRMPLWLAPLKTVPLMVAPPTAASNDAAATSNLNTEAMKLRDTEKTFYCLLDVSVSRYRGVGLINPRVQHVLNLPGVTAFPQRCLDRVGKLG